MTFKTGKWIKIKPCTPTGRPTRIRTNKGLERLDYIIAQRFLNNGNKIPVDMEVIHINGDVGDNRLDNLKNSETNQTK